MSTAHVRNHAAICMWLGMHHNRVPLFSPCEWMHAQAQVKLDHLGATNKAAMNDVVESVVNNVVDSVVNNVMENVVKNVVNNAVKNA